MAVGGKRLEMTCPVAGYPIESVVWEKDGRRLNGRQKVQLLNSSLAIDPVDKASDAGVYSCEARQHGGLSARQSFQLNVIGKSVSSFLFFCPANVNGNCGTDAPHLMPMGDVVLNAGERLALQCAVVKGGLPLSVSWFKDGQAILPSTSSSSSVRLINEFAASLTVESLTGQHAGHYVCRAANQGGRAESSVHVVVQGDLFPSVRFQKKSVTTTRRKSHEDGPKTAFVFVDKMKPARSLPDI